MNYWTPQLGQKEVIRIVGNPFQVWQDWKMKGNARWQCYSYQSAASAPPSAKLQWMIPVSVNGSICLWRVGKMVMNELIVITKDPEWGNGQWNWLYDYDVVVEKTQPQYSQFPQTTVRVKPNKGVAITPLDTKDEQRLIVEYWQKAKQEKVKQPKGSESKVKAPPTQDVKVQKILKKMGYGKQDEPEDSWKF